MVYMWLSQNIPEATLQNLSKPSGQVLGCPPSNWLHGLAHSTRRDPSTLAGLLELKNRGVLEGQCWSQVGKLPPDIHCAGKGGQAVFLRESLVLPP